MNSKSKRSMSVIGGGEDALNKLFILKLQLGKQGKEEPMNQTFTGLKLLPYSHWLKCY